MRPSLERQIRVFDDDLHADASRLCDGSARGAAAQHGPADATEVAQAAASLALAARRTLELTARHRSGPGPCATPNVPVELGGVAVPRHGGKPLRGDVGERPGVAAHRDTKDIQPIYSKFESENRARE